MTNQQLQEAAATAHKSYHNSGQAQKDWIAEGMHPGKYGQARTEFIAGFLAGAAYMEGQSAGVWVKASDQTPPNDDLVHVRYANGPSDKIDCMTTAFFDGNKWHRQDGVKGFNVPKSVEWLSESPTTGGESEAVSLSLQNG